MSMEWVHLKKIELYNSSNYDNNKVNYNLEYKELNDMIVEA